MVVGTRLITEKEQNGHERGYIGHILLPSGRPLVTTAVFIAILFLLFTVIIIDLSRATIYLHFLSIQVRGTVFNFKHVLLLLNFTCCYGFMFYSNFLACMELQFFVTFLLNEYVLP